VPEKGQVQVEQRFFDDDEGQHPLPQVHGERELLTTPYDAPVRTLLQEIEDKTLIVNPKFQRKSVWLATQKSRLIESLILNIPIPVIFLAEDEDGKRVVVDVQQRLRAIEEFKSVQYKLTGLEVLTRLNGARWSDISPREARQIQNRTIRCIVISEKSDRDIRFQVFERLNTGVTPLTDQELRNCLYMGAFNDMLEELANEQQWLDLLRKKEPDNRFRHHELILRFLQLRAL
jgi:uncharacterized protein with ParB-like and HNH nuclease domain